MRDRLIELIRDCCKFKNCLGKADLNICKNRCEATTALADHLLANGIIVPPCKVGDFVEWKTEKGTKLYRVNGFYYNPNDRGLRYVIDPCTPVIGCDSIVKIITKEQHEKALT